MISAIWKGLVWLWVSLKWLVVLCGSVALGLVYELKARADRVADISLIHCVEMITKESDLVIWEQQLRAEKADIIERETELKNATKRR